MQSRIISGSVIVVGMLITAITQFNQLLGGRRLVVELRER
jgi:hypothetical protein